MLWEGRFFFILIFSSWPMYKILFLYFSHKNIAELDVHLQSFHRKDYVLCIFDLLVIYQGLCRMSLDPRLQKIRLLWGEKYGGMYSWSFQIFEHNYLNELVVFWRNCFLRCICGRKLFEKLQLPWLNMDTIKISIVWSHFFQIGISLEAFSLTWALLLMSHVVPSVAFVILYGGQLLAATKELGGFY